MVPFTTLRAAIGLLVVLALCAGCGSSNSSKVNTATYVKTVCSAIAPLERDIVNRTQALNNSKQDAVQAKQALQGFLAAVAQDADQAVAHIKSAGTPDIDKGDAVAADIVKAFTQLRDAMHAAKAKAASLPTGSPTAYKTAAQALNNSLRDSLNNIDASGLSNPAIEQAAAKEPVCKSLSS
jgi:outer membrane murein-binding lipoprotein Lpp